MAQAFGGIAAAVMAISFRSVAAGAWLVAARLTTVLDATLVIF
jgi:hypothetical protein